MWEVHLADQAPTEQFDDQNLFGVGVDASNPSQGVYFKTANNLPWALLIVEDWDYHSNVSIWLRLILSSKHGLNLLAS